MQKTNEYIDKKREDDLDERDAEVVRIMRYESVDVQRRLWACRPFYCRPVIEVAATSKPSI